MKHAGQHLGVSLEHGRLKLHRPVTRYWPPRIAHRLRILIHQLAITTSELMWTHDRKNFPKARFANLHAKLESQRRPEEF